jgi:putative methionine-R-sulfoxide reductase with GAF domain
MTINTANEPKPMSLYDQSAYRSALILAVVTSLTLPVYLFLALRANTWQVYLSLVGLLGFAIGAWGSTRLCRQGQVKRGIWVLIIGSIAAALLGSILIAGIGLAMGVITFIIILQIATQHLPVDTNLRPILLATVMSVVMGLTDYLAFPFQYVVPSLQTVTLIVIAVILLLYAIVVIRQFSTLPLRNKLLLSFLLVTFLSVGLVASFTTARARQSLIESANQGLLAAATQTALSLDTFIANNQSAVRIEAGFPDFVAYLELPETERAGSPQESRVRRLLLQLSRKDPSYILSYALLDQQGIHVADTFFPEQGLDASNLSYFLEPYSSGSPYVSSIEQSLTEGGLSLYFSAPVRNSSGDIIGVIRVSYNAGVIQQLINQSTGLLGETSGAILLDSHGIRLADSFSPSQIMKSVIPLEPELIAALQAQRLLPMRPVETLSTNFTSFAAGLANVETTPLFNAEIHADTEHLDTVAVVAMKSRPWQVAFSIAQPVYLAPIEAQTQTTTIIALVIALLVALSAIGVAQILTAPITHLTTVAAQVAAGDLQARATVSSKDEIGTLATAFNNMTAQVNDLVGTLEQRVQERTRALEISTDVSRRLSTILDVQQLTVEVVEQIKSAFNYYHAHIYLYDDKHEYLNMAGGTGTVGEQLLAQGHKILSGRGLVGRAAASNSVILVPDVSQESGWLPNPLLPETKAEIAVPIRLGGQVLGVLDVQNNIVNSLKTSDADLLQSIANQVAIAFQNARLYAQSQQQAEQAAFINEVGQKIQNANTIERVLQIAAQELNQILGSQRTTVQISVRPEQQNGHSG